MERKCCSYEFSPTLLQCNLNEECKPTQKKHSDFLYCKKIGRLDEVIGKAKDLGETKVCTSPQNFTRRKLNGWKQASRLTGNMERQEMNIRHVLR